MSNLSLAFLGLVAFLSVEALFVYGMAKLDID